jgi:phosphohistidine phosphatase
MDLILWRHAEAEDGMADLARPLTDKGKKQAAAMAAWLDKHLPGDTRILVSPAVRAQQTAAALPRRGETVAAIAPGADAAAVLAAADWPDGKETVLIVGHQPTLGAVAAFLLCGQAQDFAIKKGGVVWLAGRRREPGPAVVLKAALTADFL